MRLGIFYHVRKEVFHDPCQPVKVHFCDERLIINASFKIQTVLMQQCLHFIAELLDESRHISLLGIEAEVGRIHFRHFKQLVYQTVQSL